jgi:hypothetical protein
MVTLHVTATLDESTLSHLGVGGGKIAAMAPGDICSMRGSVQAAFRSTHQSPACAAAYILASAVAPAGYGGEVGKAGGFARGAAGKRICEMD